MREGELMMGKTLVLWASLVFSQGLWGQTLNLWEHELTNIQEVLDLVIKDFESAHPGIKIKRSHYKTEDLRTQFQTAAMGGGGADLVLAPNDFGGPFSIMEIIQPVGAWIDSAKFPKAALSAVTDKKGKIWGVPVSVGNHLMLLGNRHLLEKLPETMEELVAVSIKLKKDKKLNYAFAYNLNEPFWFITFLSAFDGVALKDGNPHLGTKAMEQALSWVYDLKFKHKIVPENCDYACAETLFLEGKVAMIINGDWSVDKYNKHFAKDLLIGPLPKLGNSGKSMSPLVSGKYLFVNASLKGKELKAAKAFSDYLITENVQQFLVNETQRLPALLSVAGSSVVKNQPLLAKSQAAMARGVPMPMDVEMRAVWDAIRPGLQGVMAGHKKPRLAAQTMQNDALTKIKEMRE
jgi:arabinogalactan oligomer / maltooligosaccharide transport system substrate-binding protein